MKRSKSKLPVANQKAYNKAYYAKHAVKVKARAKAWRAKNKDKVREYRRKWYTESAERRRAYGRKWYHENRDAVLSSQHKSKGISEPTRPRPACCEMCGGKQKRALAADHDHSTGLFRGWLCSLCNTGLGALGDDPTAAAERLLVYSKKLKECT